MDQVEELRKAISEHGAVTFYDKRAVGRWISAINTLEDEGFCKSELLELDEQSSCLQVKKL